MRTPDKEYLELLKQSEVYQLILNTPKPDFTELDKICAEVEESMKKAQEEDRKKMLEALRK